MASFRKINGTWEYRIRFKDFASGKWKEKSKRGFSTKKEAQLAANEEVLKFEYYGFQEDGKETLNEFIVKWFELYKRPNLKQSTVDLQERNIKNNILPRWGNYKLKEITRLEYKEWLTDLSERYSEGSIRRIHSIMSTAMHDAVHEFRILRENPITRMKIPKLAEEHKIKYFSVEEMEKLICVAKEKVKKSKYRESSQHYTLIYFLFHTGLRIGEALALTWDDINFEHAQVSVDKTCRYKDKGKEVVITSTKTTSSERIIEIDIDTLEVLKEYKKNQQDMYSKFNYYKKPENDLIFHTPTGEYWRANVIREQFKVFCKRAGIPELSPHACRHSHAVHLLEAGADIKYISERLGHKSVETTYDTYTHITKKIERNALDLYKKYLKS
ncbi:site-specific integrase [Lysinibacillus halotolerans]|uniref:Site-specific integrase n=1 Tax=Lysinibacillus halotolerans TaxID=1368476 RepID=A0A3M8H774_9BACI|nr:site-specific integrase [Lysinibacillus halotolerans]RNC98268.1 site-specific integrase [Lysinibacillus halotolerans]